MLSTDKKVSKKTAVMFACVCVRRNLLVEMLQRCLYTHLRLSPTHCVLTASRGLQHFLHSDAVKIISALTWCRWSCWTRAYPSTSVPFKGIGRSPQRHASSVHDPRQCGGSPATLSRRTWRGFCCPGSSSAVSSAHPGISPDSLLCFCAPSGTS